MVVMDSKVEEIIFIYVDNRECQQWLCLADEVFSLF